MYEAALKLGVSVVKAACGIWIGNPLAENAATTVVDLVQDKVVGRRDQRRLERRFAEIEESIAERVLGYLDHEFQALPENEREAAVLAVADRFERAGPSVCFVESEGPPGTGPSALVRDGAAVGRSARSSRVRRRTPESRRRRWSRKTRL